MNRRQQIKLENAKVFARKYIFSGRYIVRNTLAVMGLATIAGGAYLAVQVGGAKVATNLVVENEATEQIVENEETEVYSVQVSDSTLLDKNSVDSLYVILEDDSVLTASNDIERLTKPEYDMTNKFIVTTEGLNVRAEASESEKVSNQSSFS